MQTPILVPSFPAPSFEALEKVFRALVGTARSFQVDIVDGDFVPHVSWPFTETNPQIALEQLAPWRQSFLLEIDCMVKNPVQYLDTVVSIGAHRVVIHMGSTDDYEEIFSHADLAGYKVGLALTNDISLDDLYPYIPHISFVQLMGIANVGQQGQPFDERTIPRIQTLRAKFPDLEIAVDGSVNAHTIPRLLAAGVNRFAPGSAITQSENPAEAYKQLSRLLE